MTDLLDGLLTDLDTETADLRAVVADLDDSTGRGWRTPTPAPGWSVAHQVAHLAWTDHAAVLAARAVTDRAGWDAMVADALGAPEPEAFVDRAADQLADQPPADLLATWDRAHDDLTAALRTHPAGEKMPWFGPPMSAASMATARFMETWAHGLDVRQALGVATEPNDRVRHVAHLAVRTRGFSYANRGEEPPTSELRVELTAPTGETWAWGPEDAEQRVTGPAYDLARLATQRAHRDDTDLVATGADADHWLDIAQCFAGPPGPGRARADE